ncbi:MAG: bile acid:sodium symporter family protein [Bullifex sp.]
MTIRTEPFTALNRKLERMMPFITPAGVLIALIFGKYFVSLKPLVNILFGLMTFFGAMKISADDIKSAFRKPMFIIAYVCASFIVMPLIAQLVSKVFFHDSIIVGSGYNLVRAVPTAVVGSVWASMFHGNLAVSLAVLLIDTLLAPALTPLMLKLFTGTAVQLDALGMMQSLCTMVVIPFLLGLVFNHFFKRQIKETIAPITNPISKILFFVEIIINVSQVSERIIREASWDYVLVIIAALCLSVTGFLVGHLISRLMRLQYKEDISITFAVALRNTNAALVLAIGFLPELAALPIIFSIVIQQTLAAIMGKLLFRKKSENPIPSR